MNVLAQTLTALNIPASPDQIKSLLRYCEELIKWNKRINLSGASTVDDFVRGPLFDALTLITVLEKKGSLIDVGSGGGLPGVPAAILSPDLKLTLCEPRKKRASFLRHVTHLLKLEVEVIESRDENLEAHKWSAAVAQAVWAPEIWLERATRLVEPGGKIYVLSSEVVDSGVEVEKQERVFREDGKQRYCCRVRLHGVRRDLRP